MNQIVEDLKEAKRLIESCGWAQGKLKDHDGCYCLDGAVAEATGFPLVRDGAPDYYDGNHEKAFDHLRDTDRARIVIGALYHSIYGIVGSEVSYAAVYSWNDMPKRTKEEVITLLDKTIKESE
jgi:hypothetical protein